MKIHPAPHRRNLTVRHPNPAVVTSRQKNLRRLPHIFAKVLELPFYSDADVSVHETSESLKFVVYTDDELIGTDIGARTIEIYPGVTKIVVDGTLVVNSVNEMELDVWRFRLPPCTVPELATASFRDGELVVVVPKEGNNFDGNLFLYSD